MTFLGSWGKHLRFFRIGTLIHIHILISMIDQPVDIPSISRAAGHAHKAIQSFKKTAPIKQAH